ncbi:MAG: DUF1998 domain-containing protein [Candidatus Heimdallarchaeota archaeon]|nr:DUF1998 domain-containing protein [Candidatus Heimdallarchaeota archaeon]
MARNRSRPGERRVNIFLFDLTNPRDLFYWENLETLQTILETNACNPILYSRQNTKVLAGLLILQLRYGINDFKQIMSFFLKEGIQTHELARQQYTKMYCSKVLRKEKGKLLFTGEGEDILVQQIKRNNILVPFSIRAISTDWTIQVQEGTNTFDFHESAKQLGKISSKDVLKKGLPGNSITRNKQHYLVTSIDHQQKSVQVKRFFIEPKTRLESSIPANRLYDPIITAGVFPKKYSGRSQTILFGQLTITRKAKAIANANPERIVVKNTEQNHNHLFNWQELTEKESEELALVEQVEGISITPSISLQSMKKLNQKLILKLFGEILLLEAEIVLSIPANEFRLAFNDIQLAIYDKGEANGNAEYLYQNLEEVAAQGLRRLQDCPCERGCKHCYGEMLGLLPEGAKSCLIAVMRGIGEENNGKDLKDNLEEEKTIQENYQDEEIISLSDIHLTSEHCYEEEFYQAVSSLSKQADIIIINGDLLDKPSDAGKKAFERLQNLALKEGFWSKLVFIRSSSIHDANIEQAASALYLDYVLIETPAGEVLFVHGNKIGIDPGEVKISTAEQAAIEAKNKLIQIGRSWLPRVTKETHLVIGHLHERFYNERWRVYGLGHWTKKGSDYHQKCLMVIEPTKTHNVIRLKNYEKEKEENGGRDRI